MKVQNGVTFNTHKSGETVTAIGNPEIRKNNPSWAAVMIRTESGEEHYTTIPAEWV